MVIRLHGGVYVHEPIYDLKKIMINLYTMISGKTRGFFKVCAPKAF